METHAVYKHWFNGLMKDEVVPTGKLYYVLQLDFIHT